LKIEIIRFLEKGYNVKLIKLSNKSIPVDKKSDLKKVLKIIVQKK
jgi:CMP-2-keto-3-deoxyoctulosonic acid synthetase